MHGKTNPSFNFSVIILSYFHLCIFSNELKIYFCQIFSTPWKKLEFEEKLNLWVNMRRTDIFMISSLPIFLSYSGSPCICSALFRWGTRAGSGLCYDSREHPAFLRQRAQGRAMPILVCQYELHVPIIQLIYSPNEHFDLK